MDCEFTELCPFFNDKLKGQESLINSYKRSYCQGNPEQCARLAVRKALGPKAVPLDLFPNSHSEAEYLIKRERK